MIQPLVKDLQLKQSIENELSVIMKRYTAPLIHAKVGNDDMPASDSDIENVSNELEDLHTESEVITSHLVDLSVLSFDKKGMDIKTPFEHIDKQILAGTNTPGILINMPTGGDTKAAEVQLRNFGRHIKNIQRQIKTNFEDLIIQKQMDGSEDDKLIWGYADEREEDIAITQLQGLVGQGIITQQKANDLLPPKYEEKLPENKPQPMDITQPGNPRPSQASPFKLKKDVNNPNDPTMSKKLKPGKRVKKSDVIPENVKLFEKFIKKDVKAKKL